MVCPRKPLTRFQSTLPVGGATNVIVSKHADAMISIHAPRGGSDSRAAISRFTSMLFQSTLPVGGATGFAEVLTHSFRISIHAPRGGSDLLSHLAPPFRGYFNPRSPWGERLASAPVVCTPQHFNPRSPWGERRSESSRCFKYSVFQSTLPVGGATYQIAGGNNATVISIHAPRGGSDLSDPGRQ